MTRIFCRVLMIYICAGLSLLPLKAVDRSSGKGRRVQKGLASFYEDRDFGGQRTASGEIFHDWRMIAAHPTYPAGTVVRVTDLENGRSVNVRIVDRGPTAKHRRKGVIIDLSRNAAQKLGFVKKGTARVRTEVLEWGNETAKSAYRQRTGN